MAGQVLDSRGGGSPSWQGQKGLNAAAAQSLLDRRVHMYLVQAQWARLAAKPSSTRQELPDPLPDQGLVLR
ncbi:hypothetical protein ACIHEI_31155 [Kitasatospora sp. NPDC051984]|uniref:hypothetical protein n=1 Tax=Kitasatospora sp. NPDC051984 TaxID=3364059 RepID=UPI0037C5EDF7